MSFNRWCENVEDGTKVRCTVLSADTCQSCFKNFCLDNAVKIWYKFPNVAPKIGDEVLVCKNFKNKQIVEIDEYNYINEYDLISTGRTTGIGFLNDECDTVTHWMPLPDAPQDNNVEILNNNQQAQ